MVDKLHICFYASSIAYRASVAEERVESYNEVMGNNPVLRSQFAQSQKASEDVSPKIKAAYERFFAELAKAKKAHREEINTVLRAIDERKIKDLKDKLKNL